MKSNLNMLAAILVMATFTSYAEIQVKDGDKVAFLGDSITQGGNSAPGGYLHLVAYGLKASGITISMVPAGISGHKSNQMLARVDTDVLAKKPQWMLLSCGVNDVWHGARGVSLEEYKTNIAEIVRKAQDAGVKVMILTSTMIREDQENPENQKLIAYNDYLRELAKEKGCLLADLNQDMQAAVEKAKTTGERITSDGVHMAFGGNKMMATGILRAFGVEEAKLTEIVTAWNALPGTVSEKIGFSQNEYTELVKTARSQNLSVQDYICSKVLPKP